MLRDSGKGCIGRPIQPLGIGRGSFRHNADKNSQSCQESNIVNCNYEANKNTAFVVYRADIVKIERGEAVNRSHNILKPPPADMPESVLHGQVFLRRPPTPPGAPDGPRFGAASEQTTEGREHGCDRPHRRKYGTTATLLFSRQPNGLFGSMFK